MEKEGNKATFFTLLLSGFIDYAGIAIVYPVFAYLLFDPSYHFFSPEATDAFKGLWLGVLIALYPLMQFFASPLLGALSDRGGRKRYLLLSLVIAFSGYLFAIVGVLYHNLVYLAIYRILVGIGASNGSVIGATVADLSTDETRARNFGLLSMSFGAGFTIAPFIGGILVNHFGYVVAFILPLMLVFINIVLVMWKLHETHQPKASKRISVWASFSLLKRATQIRALRGVFLGLLIYTLGWAFFTEFSTLFIANRFAFNPQHTGLFFGYAGLFYSLSAGFLVPLVAKKMGAANALFMGQLISGLMILTFVFFFNPIFIWIYLPFVQFFMSFVYPTTSTLISSNVSADVQGEAMGIYQAINAIGIALTPFFGGAIVGRYPWLVVVLGGGIMMAGALAFRLAHSPHGDDVPQVPEGDTL